MQVAPPSIVSSLGGKSKPEACTATPSVLGQISAREPEVKAEMEPEQRSAPHAVALQSSLDAGRQSSRHSSVNLAGFCSQAEMVARLQESNDHFHHNIINMTRQVPVWNQNAFEVIASIYRRGTNVLLRILNLLTFGVWSWCFEKIQSVVQWLFSLFVKKTPVLVLSSTAAAATDAAATVCFV